MAKKKTWWKRIDDAEKSGGFSDEDYSLAADWVTCACGQQSPLVPRLDDGTPEDPQLDTLGCDFVDRVADNEFGMARRVLRKIETRAGQVLAAELRKAKQRMRALERALA